MQISEIYVSRQGEGLLTGEPSIFVRTSGCNLRCSFCDTPYTSWSPEGTPMSIDEVVEVVAGHDEKHVVITGGEPMLPPAIGALTSRIQSLGKHITIETAGTISRDIECDLMSIIPKLANSTPTVDRAGEWRRKHEESRINLNVLRELIGRFKYQLKFVVVNELDVEEIKQLVESIEADNERVLLMPEGCLLYTSPSPRDQRGSRMPSSA